MNTRFGVFVLVLALYSTAESLPASPHDAPSRNSCTGVFCPTPRCIDPTYDEEACCPACPDGFNCWLEDSVLTNGQAVIRSSGEPSCPIYCRCPMSALEYEIDGVMTHAICTYTCTGHQLETGPGQKVGIFKRMLRQMSAPRMAPEE